MIVSNELIDSLLANYKKPQDCGSVVRRADEAVLKLFYLALMSISQKLKMSLQNWKSALNQFGIIFEDWMPIR